MIRAIGLWLSLLLCGLPLSGCGSDGPVEQTQAFGALSGQLVLPFAIKQADFEPAQLRATVDFAPARIEILGLNVLADQTVIAYKLPELPVQDWGDLVLIEIRTVNGELLLGGITSLVADHELSYHLNDRSTALLALVREKLGPRPISVLKHPDLKALEQEPGLIDKAAAIRAVLRQQGFIRPEVNDGLMLDLDQDGLDDCTQPDSLEDSLCP